MEDREKILRKEELIKNYGIDIKKLEQEQIKLAKTLEIKDTIDFSKPRLIAAIENFMIRNSIVSAVIVCDSEYEIVEQEYFTDKLRFPYIHGFRAYRELSSMIGAFAKVREKPDIVLIKAEGINHSRLGLASHFSIAAAIPAIGVSDKLFDDNEVVKEDVMKEKEIVGKVLISKKGSKPLYICPGNLISVDTAYNLVKGMIVAPHKMPEPMALAHKYARDIRSELKLD